MEQLIYNPTTKVIVRRVSEAVKVFTTDTVFKGTKAECDAKIAELGLTEKVRLNSTPISLTPPIPTPNSSAAAAFFMSQPEEVRTPFANVFKIISSLRKDEDKAILVAALAVPPELEPVRSQLISTLTS